MFYEEITKHAVSNRTYSVPEGMLVYAVGDIHGHLDLLENLHGKIEADIKQNPTKEVAIVYVGDYVDRGQQNKAVVEYLCNANLLNMYKTVYLRGNHDQGVLDMVEDETCIPRRLKYGADATLLDYGVKIYGKTNAEISESLKENLPQSHLEFFQNTQLSHVIGEYLFVHAGINPKQALDINNMEAQVDDVLRIRKPFLNWEGEAAYKIVFGHTIFKQVADFGNKLGIDTGAYATGKLSCAVLEGTTIRTLSTH